MIYLPDSRIGKHALRLSTIFFLIAQSDLSNKGWALVVASPPMLNSTNYVLLTQSASPSHHLAEKVLNVICRVVDPSISPVSSHHLIPFKVSVAEAQSSLNVIGLLSKTRAPLCSHHGVAPKGALKMINYLVDVDPLSPHENLPNAVPPAEFYQTVNLVRDVSGQVRSVTMPQ